MPAKRKAAAPIIGSTIFRLESSSKVPLRINASTLERVNSGEREQTAGFCRDQRGEVVVDALHHCDWQSLAWSGDQRRWCTQYLGVNPSIIHSNELGMDIREQRPRLCEGTGLLRRGKRVPGR